MTLFDTTTSTPMIVPVAHSRGRYDIVIGAGLLEEAGRRLAPLIPGGACVIVTDANVARHQLGRLAGSLDAAGLRHSVVTLAPGEGSKRFAVYEDVCETLLATRLERGDLIVAFGGGVIGDLAGFVAATLKRGLRYVQIPTSLLAQVDSSVGGKTGLNARAGKNLVGAFHPPSLVLADTDCLDTLPLREFRAGYAEVVKYGLIDDPHFFVWLEGARPAVFAGGAERAAAIVASCRAKAAVTARDEFERGDRALLNLGHTFGHALERLVDYDGARLVHGEAVAIGMVLAFRFSVAQGLCAGAEAERVEAHLAEAGLPTRIAAIPGWREGAGAMLEAMLHDKKVTQGHLNLILVRGIGRAFMARDVEASAVLGFLEAERSRT